MSEENVEVVRRYYASRYYGERSEAPETLAAEASAFWESDGARRSLLALNDREGLPASLRHGRAVGPVATSGEVNGLPHRSWKM